MAAPQKVSNDQVLLAWGAWGGERAAADALRISRTALRKRLRALGIDSTRGAKQSIAPGGAKVTTDKVQSKVQPGSSGLETAVGNYPRAVGAPIVQRMATATEDALPIPTLAPRSRPIRIDLENQKALEAVTDRLRRAFRVETDSTLIVNAFLRETLEPWAQAKEALAQPKKGRAK